METHVEARARELISALAEPREFHWEWIIIGKLLCEFDCSVETAFLAVCFHDLAA